MGGPPYDCLANPLGAVRLTFDKAIAASSSSLDGKDWGAVDLFHQFLSDQSSLSQVPILSASSLRWVQPNTLVRFRGMIQDMFGNEFYVGAYRDGSVWRTNKYTDVAQFPIGSTPDMQIWERRLLYCVPVPGLNSWAFEVASDACINGTAQQQRDKRGRMQFESMNQNHVKVSGDESEGSPCSKRMREDGHYPSPSSQSHDYNIPALQPSKSMLPAIDNGLVPCLVKIYDSPENELKLNDVFEFIGVVTLDSDLASEKDDHDNLSDDYSDDVSACLPPSKVPGLHCIIHRKLAVSDYLRVSPIIEPKPHIFRDVRDALLRHLTTVLGNDNIAANFMLLHLLSRVHARVDNVAVGKLSLNLTCLNKESISIFGTQLKMALKNLIPSTTFMPLSVEYLNRTSLAPKKDYQSNRLITGVLQLAEGSHLTIDETQLEVGTLSSVGIDNARLLKNLIELQKVEYDFTYYKMEMASDIQLLILSEGKSNILPADVIIPFRPSSAGSSEVVVTETLDVWRWYLATVRSLPHSIDCEIQKVIENDLVAARQADRSLGGQEFSRLLTMGRLICASVGDTSLSLEHWQMVKELERQRRERIK